jgi:hypothetical protein
MTLKDITIEVLDYLITIAIILFSIPFGITVAIAIFVIGLIFLVAALIATPIYFLYKWKDDIRYL